MCKLVGFIEIELLELKDIVYIVIYMTFILICPCYIDIRKKYIKRYYYIRPSMLKFTDMLKSNNRSILLNLSLYVRDAMSYRNNLDIVDTT